MVEDPRPLGEQIKEQLQLLLLGLLGIIRNGEFWAMVAGCGGLLVEFIQGKIDQWAFVGGAVGLIVTFIIGQTVRKVKAMTSNLTNRLL